MARVTNLVRQAQNADARYAREMAAMKCAREMVAVPFEWHTQQSADAIKFPSYGWVPAVAVRWRKADGSEVPWSCGRQGDTLLIDANFANPRRR